jgi:hypothetical protein
MTTINAWQKGDARAMELSEVPSSSIVFPQIGKGQTAGNRKPIIGQGNTLFVGQGAGSAAAPAKPAGTAATSAPPPAPATGGSQGSAAAGIKLLQAARKAESKVVDAEYAPGGHYDAVKKFDGANTRVKYLTDLLKSEACDHKVTVTERKDARLHLEWAKRELDPDVAQEMIDEAYLGVEVLEALSQPRPEDRKKALSLKLTAAQQAAKKAEREVNVATNKKEAAIRAAINAWIKVPPESLTDLDRAPAAHATMVVVAESWQEKKDRIKSLCQSYQDGNVTNIYEFKKEFDGADDEFFHGRMALMDTLKALNDLKALTDSDAGYETYMDNEVKKVEKSLKEDSDTLILDTKYSLEKALKGH